MFLDRLAPVKVLKVAAGKLKRDSISDFVCRFPDRLRMAGQLVKIRLNENIVSLDGLRFDTGSDLLSTSTIIALYRGTYEASERQLIERYLPANDPIIELGGCIGVVSCFVNRHLDDPTCHVVVEANEAALQILEKNRQLNGCEFHTRLGALGYGEDESFYVNENAILSSKYRPSSKKVSVAMVTLEDIFDAFGFEVVNLICDIEGSEVELLAEEMPLISKRVKLFMVELHRSIVGEDEIDRIFQRLKHAGFDHVDDLDGVHCFLNSKWN